VNEAVSYYLTLNFIFYYTWAMLLTKIEAVEKTLLNFKERYLFLSIIEYSPELYKCISHNFDKKTSVMDSKIKAMALAIIIIKYLCSNC